MDFLKPGRPPGWEQPKLTTYFEALWANTVATFVQKNESHRLCRIDDLMFEIASGWEGKSPTAASIVPLMMFFRSHSAFRAAAAFGMGGAVVEGMAGLRQCLEFAGYASLVNYDKALAQIWWDRDQNEESEKKVRRAFTHGAVQSAIHKSDAGLAEIYDKLYGRVIQFGSHPNEKSVSGSLKLDVQKAETVLLQIHLQGDGSQLDHWIHTANQVGICVLKIFEHIHTTRFAGLEISARIDALAKDL
jgi:hypothetical protein